jgi:hypothetical protein
MIVLVYQFSPKKYIYREELQGEKSNKKEEEIRSKLLHSKETRKRSRRNHKRSNHNAYQSKKKRVLKRYQRRNKWLIYSQRKGKGGIEKIYRGT